MKKVVIERIESSDHGTFGRLIVPGLTLFTGELPWRDNKTNISCIPVGTYKCSWTLSARFKRFMYLVEGNHQRAGIRKHSANFMGNKDKGYKYQLNGCIALGEKIGKMDGQKCLFLSAVAMRRFESFMDHQSFILEIKNA